MTNNNNKLRAITMTALMVLSVFAGSIAFSGSVAAASVNDVQFEGGAVHYVDSDSAKGAVVEVPVNNTVDSASLTAENFTLLDDGDEVSGIDDTDINQANGVLTINTSGRVIQSNDLTVDISSNVTGVGEGEFLNPGEKDVAFASQTIAHDVPTDDFPAFKGAAVAIDFDTPNNDVQLEGPNNYFISGSSGVGSEVFVFNTDGVDLGDYEVSGDVTNGFNVTVRDLGLDVTMDSLNVTTNDEIEGTVSSNNGGSPVRVELIDSDDNEDGVSNITLDGQGEADFTFPTQDADDYTVEVTDLNTGVEVTSDTISVVEASDARASFAPNVVTDQRGDVVNITINMRGTTTSNVTVGSEDVGYLVNMTVEDGDEDGEVVLQFNTAAAAGSQAAAYSVADSDDDVYDFDVGESLASGKIPDAGDYELEIDADEDGDSDNVGTLVLEERETSELAIWTAPKGTTFKNTEDVTEAVNDGNLTQQADIAEGDLLVHQFQATGLEGSLNAQKNEDVTDEFFAAVGASAVDVTINQSNPGPNREALRLALGTDNTTVIADGDNDTYFVVVDTSSVEGVRENGGTTKVSPLDLDNRAYSANVTVTENTDLADDDQTVTADFELVDAEIDFDNDPINVTAAENQTVSGTTSLAPGTQVQVRLTSTGDTQPRFLKTTEADVTQNGTFSADFDFSEQQVGDEFEARASATTSNAGSVTVDGNVVESTETETTTEETTTEETTTEETTEETTESSTPGFGIAVALVALVAAALLAVRRD